MAWSSWGEKTGGKEVEWESATAGAELKKLSLGALTWESEGDLSGVLRGLQAAETTGSWRRRRES